MSFLVALLNSLQETFCTKAKTQCLDPAGSDSFMSHVLATASIVRLPSEERIANAQLGQVWKAAYLCPLPLPIGLPVTTPVLTLGELIRHEDFYEEEQAVIIERSTNKEDNTQDDKGYREKMGSIFLIRSTKILHMVSLVDNKVFKKMWG